jgi:Ni,Fe-hydrogenase III small subunit/formate hydrogenlyase subunit 6/NADH:ubiquinone oxidoreductase subunit I
MLKILRARLHQGRRTTAFPEGPAPSLPERFRGRPELDAGKCRNGCRECAEACPTDAIRIIGGARSDEGQRGMGAAQGMTGGSIQGGATDEVHQQDRGKVRIDLGRCLFCDECRLACPEGALVHGSDYRLATRTREDLLVGVEGLRLAAALEEKTRRLFGRSLRLRVVSAGGCNACEADTNVLTTIGWDIGRFGIQYVAAPRHADGLLVTGPVTRNMRLALRKTYDAVPSPKIVIAVGACAISGGPYREQPEQIGGADVELPVDLYIPGCPPHPLTILDGFLRLLGRIGSRG